MRIAGCCVANLGHTLGCKKTVLVTILLDIYQSGLFQQCRGVSKIHFTQGVVESTLFCLLALFLMNSWFQLQCVNLFSCKMEKRKKTENIHSLLRNNVYQLKYIQ